MNTFISLISSMISLIKVGYNYLKVNTSLSYENISYALAMFNVLFIFMFSNPEGVFPYMLILVVGAIAYGLVHGNGDFFDISVFKTKAWFLFVLTLTIFVFALDYQANRPDIIEKIKHDKIEQEKQEQTEKKDNSSGKAVESAQTTKN